MVNPSKPWPYRAAIAALLLSTMLFVLTLVDPQWIERLFDESPDGGDGSAESWIVGASLLVAALASAALAWRERRRLANGRRGAPSPFRNPR
jgi:hypothetical protein